MIKKILQSIGKALLKLDRFKQAVEDYKSRQQKQRDDQLFVKIMIAGRTIREVKEPKIVTKGYIDSRNWGGTKL